MKIKSSIIKKVIIVIPIVIVLVIFIKLYYDISQGTNPKKQTKKPSIIKTISPNIKSYSKTIKSFGTLKAITSVDIYTKEQNRIVKLYADTSDWVRKGQILVQLMNSELIERKIQKEAVLKVELAGLNRDNVIMKNKELTLGRLKKAYRENIIPQQELDNAIADYETSAAQVELAKAKINEARASIREITVKLSETKIHSPLSGTIAKRYLNVGDLANPAKPILKVIDISEVKLIINLSEGEYSNIIDQNGLIKKNINVRVIINSINKELNAKIYKVYPTIDPKTRTFTIEIRVKNIKRLLKPGFYCQAELTLNTKKNAIFIPVKAVKVDEIQQKTWVQLINNDKVSIKEIKVNPYNSSELVILKGISKNDRLVSPYNPRLKDGDIIKLRSNNKP